MKEGDNVFQNTQQVKTDFSSGFHWVRLVQRKHAKVTNRTSFNRKWNVGSLSPRLLCSASLNLTILRLNVKLTRNSFDIRSKAKIIRNLCTDMWLFLWWRHEIKTIMKSNGSKLERFFDTSNIVPERLAGSVWRTKSRASFLKFYLRLSLSQSSLLLIHFCYGPNICSQCTKVWHKPYPICDAPLSRSARRS